MIGPMANMTIEQLYQLEAELQFEFILREGWRAMATTNDEQSGDEESQR